jgi:hypothetical protein
VAVLNPIQALFNRRRRALGHDLDRAPGSMVALPTAQTGHDATVTGPGVEEQRTDVDEVSGGPGRRAMGAVVRQRSRAGPVRALGRCPLAWKGAAGFPPRFVAAAGPVAVG